jgi:1-acyl-sn-glycerol-3-phosphate acyltransferase
MPEPHTVDAVHPPPEPPRGDAPSRRSNVTLDSASRTPARASYAALRSLTHALSLGWRVRIHGLEHLPPTGPAIIAANHRSFLDGPLLMFLLPRRVWFLGKADYLDSWTTRRLFPAVGMIPLERTGQGHGLSAMRSSLDVLQRGEVLGVFPEGTRSRDGLLHRGHTGLAWLALRSGAPIVPIGITGTAEVQPPGARLPRLRGTCSINVGPPIPTDRYDGRDRRAHRALTDEVMFEISQLSGQRYVDTYATPPAPHPPGGGDVGHRPAPRSTADKCAALPGSRVTALA